MSRIIAVVGATGAQGGGLVRAIQSDPQGGFTARALTRNPGSERAKALSDAGVEVVAADLDDSASLRAAFEGAHGAFCLTNFWELFDPARELVQAKSLAQAAREAGVHHAVWSTLENTRDYLSLDDDRMPTLMDKYKVPHFDAKGEADPAFLESGIPVVTCLRTSFYWENFIQSGMGPQKGEDGKYGIAFPMGDKPLPGISAEDIGKCAYGIFKAGDTYAGRTVGIEGDLTTGAEMAERMGRALGMEVVYRDVPPEVYRAFPFDGADDIGNMFQFKRDFNDAFVGNRSLEESRRLNPDLQDFETWLERNKGAIPVS